MFFLSDGVKANLLHGEIYSFHTHIYDDDIVMIMLMVFIFQLVTVYLSSWRLGLVWKSLYFFCAVLVYQKLICVDIRLHLKYTTACQY